jgi:N-acetylmuramoyl-L-alanine amidase
MSDLLTEIDVLARTIWGEARGQGSKGMRAVAHVVLNRVRLARVRGRMWWGDTVIDVCRKPYQFSCWNANDPNREKLLVVTDKNAVFRQALAIARSVLRGADTDDPTFGSTHYHRYDIAPNWSRGVNPVVRIKDHVFFDLS